MSRVTPEMLKSKSVFDSNDNKVGIISQIIRERYEKINVDFIEITLERKIKIGPATKVKVRTRDAKLLPDGTVKVKFTKDQLKIMAKEQELQRHPPTI
ncbi:MAG: hypothetical protein ACTSXO_08850 [Candidatus Heimdallarchaeota archaeon]|nr:MAG: hypothetical protein DRP02_01250 [Candidatus Gerdarchaeota archaeon]